MRWWKFSSKLRKGEERERRWKGRGRWKKAREGEQRGTCSQSPVHSGIAEGAWKENNAGFPRARLSEASRKQIEILRVATDIQMRFYRGTRYVFDVFGHLFATRLHFLPFDFELDSNYRLLSLNNAILFFHTRVLSTRAVSDHSVEYFSFGSQENPVKSVEITTRWKLVSSRLVSSCVARNERISRRGWRGQLFGCRCSGNSGISRE